MTLPELALSVFALLATPGPTNTLMAVAGAERGASRALRLIPAELGAYLATTVPLALLGGRLLDSIPEARTAITLVAAAWVLWLAAAMWRLPPARSGIVTVTARRVAVTTLLNPKALIFGLVLLPAESGARLLAHFGTFAALVVGVAAAWIALGAVLAQGGRAEPGLPSGWRRAASVWLGALGFYLFGHAVGLA